MNTKCMRYNGAIIREEHGHYVVILNDKEICRVDTVEEAKQEVDNNDKGVKMD